MIQENSAKMKYFNIFTINNNLLTNKFFIISKFNLLLKIKMKQSVKISA